MQALLILGNQLFTPSELRRRLSPTQKPIIFMREDHELCTHFKYHKHKIILFLAAMRHYAVELRENGFQVHYEELDSRKGTTYEEALTDFLASKNISEVFYFEIEDKFFEKRLKRLFQKLKTSATEWRSPLFLTSREDFKKYLNGTKRPFMKTFYEQQRKELKILLDTRGGPVGGKWSFDEENRQALPKNVKPPVLPELKMSPITKEICRRVDELFKDHPGKCEEFWLPVDRKAAKSWLNDFLEKRFHDFGPYEDALVQDSPFVFHSVLSPILNLGLLTPSEIVDATLAHAQKYKTPLNSCEGFIRQVIGWREFIRGIYQNFGDEQESANFFGHHQKLAASWYKGTTGIEPLDDVIKKTIRYGYAHHIERLMVVGSLMLLLEIDPQDAYRWYMEMLVDSSDWVMGPNVFGMALFSDGGIFATKPYFCGSNYYRKMGGYKSNPAEAQSWQDGVDGLYWSFIEKNKKFFSKNPRLSMMVRTVEKMPATKKKKIYAAAKLLRDRLTK